MDSSFSAYIAIIPAVIIPVFLAVRFKEQTIRNIMLFYTSAWILLLALICTIDAELFSFWGFRLDNTVFRYSGTFGESASSALSSPIYLLLFIFIVYACISLFFFRKLFHSYNFSELKILEIPATLFSAALLVIPIRGGFQQMPINESVSYYSTHAFLNQAALNPVWTLAHSIIEQNKPPLNRYTFFNDLDASKIVYNSQKGVDSIIASPLTTQRPNIVLIVWESLTSKVLTDSVTPNLYSLLDDGIYFSNLYATGDRSDKGLVGLLSGYPAQPDFSIMTEPDKSRKLPFITRQLKDAGYQTEYIYGGELEFANMNSYMKYNGFDNMIGKSNFKNVAAGAWGAHDEATFDLLFNNIQQGASRKNPFFYTLFTLSSHEPYDVPVQHALTGNSQTAQFQNAHHYTDSCFYDFIQKAKQQAWWNNTWIIVVADHGHVLPGGDYATHEPSEFHIPMLWLGGAVKKKAVLKQTHQQISLAPSIAQYLNLNPEAFHFSKPINCNDDTTRNIAWYSFNDGFGCTYDLTNFEQFNLNSQQISVQKGFVDPKDLIWSKAFLQVVMKDFTDK